MCVAPFFSRQRMTIGSRPRATGQPEGTIQPGAQSTPPREGNTCPHRRPNASCTPTARWRTSNPRWASVPTGSQRRRTLSVGVLFTAACCCSRGCSNGIPYAVDPDRDRGHISQRSHGEHGNLFAGNTPAPAPRRCCVPWGAPLVPQSPQPWSTQGNPRIGWRLRRRHSPHLQARSDPVDAPACRSYASG